jgi:hypothetical protein
MIPAVPGLLRCRCGGVLLLLNKLYLSLPFDLILLSSIGRPQLYKP